MQGKSQETLTHSGEKAVNSFGELGPKREVVLNGFKGPESDFGGSKIRTDSYGPFGSNLARFGQNLAKQN
jgi:hypothetical protein